MSVTLTLCSLKNDTTEISETVTKESFIMFNLKKIFLKLTQRKEVCDERSTRGEKK